MTTTLGTNIGGRIAFLYKAFYTFKYFVMAYIAYTHTEMLKKCL